MSKNLQFIVLIMAGLYLITYYSGGFARIKFGPLSVEGQKTLTKKV